MPRISVGEIAAIVVGWVCAQTRSADWGAGSSSQ